MKFYILYFCDLLHEEWANNLVKSQLEYVSFIQEFRSTILVSFEKQE